MLKQFVPGIDKIILDEISSHMIFLFDGKSSPLKSVFMFQLMGAFSKDENLKGLFVSFTPNKAQQCCVFNEMNLDVSDDFLISDYSRLKNEFADEIGGFNLFESLIRIILRLKKEKQGRLSSFVLDSINSASLMLPSPGDLETQMIHFADVLRSLSVLNFWAAQLNNKEGQLACRIAEWIADGIICIDEKEICGIKQGTIQVKRMRNLKYRKEPFRLILTDKGLQVGCPIFEQD